MTRLFVIVTMLIMSTLACSLPGVEELTVTVGPISDSTLTDTITPEPPFPTDTATITLTPSATTYPDYTPTRIPSSTLTVPSVVVVTVPVATQWVLLPETGVFMYVVKKGETLYGLAGRFCGDTREYVRLMQVNGIERGERLQVGQKIWIDCGN